MSDGHLIFEIGASMHLQGLKCLEMALGTILVLSTQ